MILFGHPTGNPNSHHAALAYWEAEKLEAFCVPWFPSQWELKILGTVPNFKNEFTKIKRRYFQPLATAPKKQHRLGEWARQIRRKNGGGEELSYEANDWLMKTMAKETSRPNVKAVHSYEDCSLLQFQAAKRSGKACIYDMPIGYYGWWEKKEAELAKKYRDWLPLGGLSSSRWVRPEQKKREMELADIVLAPSTFVAQTICDHFNKDVQIVPYGSDLNVGLINPSGYEERCKFLFSGTASLRKGIPFLLEVWAQLDWKDAELVLAGGWQLDHAVLKRLPRGVTYAGLLSREGIRKLYQECHWLVHPSNFEGFSLSILEALGSGLPVVASTATGAADLGTSGSVILFEPENSEQLLAALTKAKNMLRPEIATQTAEIARRFTWEKYREGVLRASRRLGL